MIWRPAIHRVRDTGVALARFRPFKPIENVENRIILVRPDHFGDMLMLAPTINQIRDRVQGYELVLMTGPWNRDIAGHIAHVDRVLTWDFPGFERDSSSSGRLEPYREIGEAAAMLRALQPTAVILLRDDHWWGAWMAREAGIPLRFGYAHPQIEAFLSHPMEITSKHYVEQNLELVERSLTVVGLPPLEACSPVPLHWPVHAGGAEEATAIRARHGVTGEYLIVHPGTGAAIKQWPAERWAEVLVRLFDWTAMPVFLTGSPDERALCEEIARRANNQVLNLAGETTLFSLAETFRNASLVIGVDSGPLHLATAVGTPSVHLYGPSDHVRYGPWGDPAKHCVVRAGMRCPSCGDLSATRPEGCGCMMAISADHVMTAVRKVLGNES